VRRSSRPTRPRRKAMSAPNLVERRPATPAPESHRSWYAPDALPQALMSEHLQRLAVCAAIGAALWTYGVVMDTVVRPFTVHAAVPLPSVVVEIVAILVSLASWAYVRLSRQPASRKVDAGLVYVVLNAAGVAVINATTGLAAESGGRGLSWNTVVILVAAMVLPATPRRILGAALVSACMDPIAAGMAHLYGARVASLGNTLVLYMPNFACALVATLPAHALHRIGRRLRQAQEMGSYRLVELLGRGGMGEVWRAKHRLLARDAAIKLIRPELVGAGSSRDTYDMLRRFEREARATAALSSPHTIQVFDFGATADQQFYYVMELLEGRDLQSLVREFGPTPEARALFLLRQVCHSLADAHSRGLVHRDVTPSNVYVCRMGLDYDFVKVLDFGLVKFNGRRSLEPMQKFHTTTGTPAFMAPEIVLGAEVDQRADVYAIGCVAYFLLTGQPVFEAETPRELFALHLQARPAPPSRRTELPVSREMDALVLACLEKDPRRRPHDAAAVLEMLTRCRPADPWDNTLARAWWERHLVELTGPLRATA
jgi:eukaryotic-like serine/threonine-protein kinase